MYAINWAANYPHKTACVYVDAPVCDVFSWPGKDRGYANEWQQFLDAWGLNNETASGFNQQAINYVDTLIAKNIPLILVAGKKDKIVPYKENALLLKKKYEASDVDFEAIIKKRCDHHPHSLDDPTPIVEFIMKHQ
jgi:alpha-beta hydrolase superfamily lysophospholipase